MRVSIFTPTNNPRYLEDAHRSLQGQTVQEWEWVLAPNGGAVVPPSILEDARVRVVDPGVVPQGVGALKKFAASRCSGDLLVELDHDDFLAPRAIERLLWHAQDSGAGFLYSDFVVFRPDHESVVYSAEHGWESYPTQLGGREYRALRAFPADPSSLYWMWYAPNHVRAWTREAYQKTGGHDPGLEVADDLDLVARTYLAGCAFRHIPEPLYWYREHRGDTQNSYARLSDTLQQLQSQVTDRHAHALVHEWCRRNALRRIDITAGDPSPRGYESWSYQEGPDVDRVLLPGGTPSFVEVESNSVGALRIFDTAHRFTHPVRFWEQVYRVLAPGGWLMLRVPSAEGRGPSADPWTRWLWTPATLYPVTKAAFRKASPGITARFRTARAWESYPTDWHKQNRFLFVHADLIALKGQRIPGLVEV